MAQNSKTWTNRIITQICKLNEYFSPANQRPNCNSVCNIRSTHRKHLYFNAFVQSSDSSSVCCSTSPCSLGLPPLDSADFHPSVHLYNPVVLHSNQSSTSKLHFLSSHFLSFYLHNCKESYPSTCCLGTNILARSLEAFRKKMSLDLLLF